MIKKEIRVICPSHSFEKCDQERIDKLEIEFEKRGYQLTFGNYVWKKDETYNCATIEERVKDLEDAFKDPNVYAILCGKGGFNVNQILPYLNYDIIKNNPKYLCGMSDITALLMAVYMKTGINSYLGPTLMRLEDEISIKEYFDILEKKEINLRSPGYFIENNENVPLNYIPLKKGSAEGVLIAANLCTLNLLQGTDFLKQQKNVILFIEDDDNYKEDGFFKEFDRNLESLLQTNYFEIKAILFGVFESSTKMNQEKLLKLISLKPQLKNIPSAMNINFGHTNPMTTLPIGSKVTINIDETISIQIKNK